MDSSQACYAYGDGYTAGAAMDAALPSRKRSFSDLESQRLDDSLDALDMLGLNAPVLSVDLNDAGMTRLFTEPLCSTESPKRRAASVLAKSKGKQAPAQPKTPSHKHTKSHAASKKASKQQVHELQAMVNEMQVQVNGAAAEIQQLAQLVGQFAHQREQEQAQYRQHEAEQEELYQQREREMAMDSQQRHFEQQIKQERQQFMHQQHLHQQHMQLQQIQMQQCLGDQQHQPQQRAFLCQTEDFGA